MLRSQCLHLPFALLVTFITSKKALVCRDTYLPMLPLDQRHDSSSEACIKDGKQQSSSRCRQHPAVKRKYCMRVGGKISSLIIDHLTCQSCELALSTMSLSISPISQSDLGAKAEPFDYLDYLEHIVRALLLVASGLQDHHRSVFWNLLLGWNVL